MKHSLYRLMALLLVSVGFACDRARARARPPQCADGEFGNPFEEPTLLGLPTSRALRRGQEGETRCKPTAGTLVALPDDRFLYWNALEGTEDVEVSLIAEFGYVTTNDQSRLLTLAPGTTRRAGCSPRRSTAARSATRAGSVRARRRSPVDNGGADAALFCSDQKMLHDGRVLAAGGTDYYNDTCVDWNATLPHPHRPFPPGAAELEGIKNARIFDPATNEWTQTDSMEFGRWYPAAVTLPDGDVFIASGVTRLVKPVYPDARRSGRNVFQTETYDTACGTWSTNPPTAERSLPLFPRMHLLPNGHAYFNAGGQAFNPFGQAYDELLWNLVACYDPVIEDLDRPRDRGLPGPLTPLGLQSIATDLNPTNPNAVTAAARGPRRPRDHRSAGVHHGARRRGHRAAPPDRDGLATRTC